MIQTVANVTSHSSPGTPCWVGGSEMIGLLGEGGLA